MIWDLNPKLLLHIPRSNHYLWSLKNKDSRWASNPESNQTPAQNVGIEKSSGSEGGDFELDFIERGGLEGKCSRQRATVSKGKGSCLLYLLLYLLQLSAFTDLLLRTWLLLSYLLLCSPHTHTDAHTHTCTCTHTRTHHILSTNHVPHTVIPSNPHSGASSPAFTLSLGESLSSSSATCPLNLSATHIYILLCSTGLLEPPLCSLKTRRLFCLFPESRPNLPQPWAPPLFFPSDSTSESIHLCSCLSPPTPAPP